MAKRRQNGKSGNTESRIFLHSARWPAYGGRGHFAILERTWLWGKKKFWALFGQFSRPNFFAEKIQFFEILVAKFWKKYFRELLIEQMEWQLEYFGDVRSRELAIGTVQIKINGFLHVKAGGLLAVPCPSSGKFIDSAHR